MKYSEFKREVEKMGFVVADSGVPIYVEKEGGETLLSVGKESRFWLDPGWGGFEALDEVQKLELYALGYKLAKTPLAEREEEKKYHLKLELPIPLEDSSMHWLNQKVGASKYHFGSQENIRDYKTIFTESEVAQMDLTGLKLIEVKDE